MDKVVKGWHIAESNCTMEKFVSTVSQEQRVPSACCRARHSSAHCFTAPAVAKHIDLAALERINRTYSDDAITIPSASSLRIRPTWPEKNRSPLMAVGNLLPVAKMNCPTGQITDGH